MEFTFSNKAKMSTYILMGVGLLGVGIDLVMNGFDSTRFWSNLYINGFFFFAIALGALFFLALQYATEAAWATLLKRIFEGIMSYLPYGAAVVLLVLLVGRFHGHHLFHWMDSSLYDPASENYDHIIAGKAGYFTDWFFWLRTIIYMAVFLLFARGFRKRSLQEDLEGGTTIHFLNYKKGAWFLVFFAVFSTTLSWDWLMSIDTHWFSTLYGWYVFSGMWVTAMITSVMLVLYLKGKGHLPQVNENHIHDLGKWMFAISILWSYLWFSQFMLIWYSDIPEEVTYFMERFEHYKIPFIAMFFVNLLFPLIILMSRDAKRNNKFLMVVGLIIALGHWTDVFLLITPGTMHDHWEFGLMEVGMLAAFLGLFIHVIVNAMTKAPLQPVNHPYLEESIHHHI